MAKLDVDWLGVFTRVYETHSVSRAAEQLGIGQANASIALAKLRRHFDDPLFVRTSRGMEPTPKARVIHPELAQALACLEKARGARSLFDPGTAKRRFRLCMTDISEIVLLPRLLNHLREVGPGLEVESETLSVDSARQLESGHADIAVGFVPALEAGFFQQALFDQDFVCLASASHPRVQGKVTRRAFLAEGHIVVTTSGTGHSIVDKVLARSKMDRRVVLRLQSFLGVSRIVAQTELLVIVPRLLGETLATQESIQRLRPPVVLPAYQVKQHWHARFHQDAGNVWLRGCMASLFARGKRR